MKAYDTFQVNLLEMLGIIDRKSFHFVADNCKVWYNGDCIFDLDSTIEIVAEVSPFDGELEVHIDNSEIEKYVTNQINFSEISLLNDRVLWSNNLLGSGEGYEYGDMSLFYANSSLSRIYINRKNPLIMLEFNSTEEKQIDINKFLEEMIRDGQAHTMITQNEYFNNYQRLQNPGDDFSEVDSNFTGLNNEGKLDFKYYAHLLKSKHTKIINFFQENMLGTSMPIMTYFSILEPIDRVIVLEQLFSPYSLNSNLQDKLLLGYVKIGRKDLAQKVVESSKQKGENSVNVWGLLQKIDIGIPNKIFDYQRIEKLNEWRISETGLLEIQFIDILLEFITNIK